MSSLKEIHHDQRTFNSHLWLDRVAGQTNDQSNTPIGRYVGIKQRGLVVFLDVLGMKKISDRLEYNEVTSKWDKIIEFFVSMENEGINNFSLNLNHRALSDTIIITIPNKNNSSLEDMLNNTFYLLLEPFINSIQIGLLLRGIISYGEFHWSEKLIIGPAVDDAASHHDKVDWIGISSSPKLIRDINLSKINFNNSITYNKIPHKDGHYPGLVLNWPIYDDGSNLSNLEKEENNVDNSNENEDTKDYIKRKYRNTYEFYHYCRNNLKF